MTIGQFCRFLAAVRETSTYRDLRSERDYVSMYDICNHFVKPWTEGTGCGVALLMNHRAPLQAELMVSHSWAEDVDETEEALTQWARDAERAWGGSGDQYVVWFCLFSLYQPGDPSGPSIAQQLELRPFQTVIESKPRFGMAVVHTTSAEPYERLWVVHEIDVALEERVAVRGIGHCTLQSRQVQTHAATCSSPDDEAMIRREVDRKGGYARLDEVIMKFRSTMIKRDAPPQEVAGAGSSPVRRIIGEVADFVCNCATEEAWMIERSFKPCSSLEVGRGVSSGLVRIGHFKLLLGLQAGSVYDGGLFMIDYQLLHNYPFNPPVVKFDTPILHPNVSTATGEICMDVLKDQWAGPLKIREVVMSLISLLLDPEPDDPKEPEVALLYKTDRSLFMERARQFTRQHASAEVVRSQFDAATEDFPPAWMSAIDSRVAELKEAEQRTTG